MTARRSNTPVWVVLPLVLGIVSLSVTAYSLWVGKARVEQQLDQAVEQRDQAKKAHETALAQVATLRRRINHEADLGFAELLQAIDDDLREFGTGTPSETYRDIVRRLQTL